MDLPSQQLSSPAELASAFEHSITWEDDIWRADPVDVEDVHAKARQRFFDLLSKVRTAEGGAAASTARILLFHGQSGAGKTHLIRALRTGAHASSTAYFGYAQMTPDVGQYADYFLRRLINSLDKPYDPYAGGESALARLARKLVEDAGSIGAERLEMLREGELDDQALASLIYGLADEIVASSRFAGQELDVNILRALLYLQRADPRVDQRVRQYLCGKELTSLDAASVAALERNSGEGRAFEIIEALGKIMWGVDKAALVYCIDQVEDLRFFDDAEERFQRAARDLIQIANRLPSAIIVISCLDDFYSEVRSALAQSYIDRLEKAGPVALLEARTASEARLIITKRLAHEVALRGAGASYPDPATFLGDGFFNELAGLSTRKLLEHAQKRLASMEREPTLAADPGAGFISTLAAALGFGGEDPEPQRGGIDIDYREIWERFAIEHEPEISSDDGEMLDLLAGALKLAADEWGDDVDVKIKRPAIADELPLIDIAVGHGSGHAYEARVYLCNRPTQGGGFKRQLDKVLQTATGRTCFMLRASEYPPNGKNQTAVAYRKYREGGGRSLLVPIAEWERMMTVLEFHRHHRTDPGFAAWFARARLVSGLITIAQLLRLDLLGRSLPIADPKGSRQVVAGAAEPKGRDVDDARARDDRASAPTSSSSQPTVVGGYHNLADWTGWGGSFVPSGAANDAAAEMVEDAVEEEQLPLSVLLDENGDNVNSIHVGRELATGRPVTLNKSIMKRHSAVLGGSGSGKTTLALSIIEQLLLRGVPVVLIDRKGDLCSYANPDVWRSDSDDPSDRTAEREKLADAIDVAVYTPGRSSGRPISITLLPNGINELPDHEQQLLANLSAAALGDMLHLKNSATHQKQSGTLSVALRILGSRSSRAVMLSDLIDLLEEEDPELTELTQRMDPSGKLRRDLVAQLDSLRHRNAALFAAGGENLRMESLLGLGPYARPGRTRLSVIYTGFLGDNENILFWVAQFLSEALRFCQRNPNDELQAVVMFDEADLYIPANSKPATAEPLQSLLKRARSAGLGLMLATQSPGDLDYKSRDQITSWFIGRVREDTALRKLKAAFQSESGLDASAVLPHQTVGEFHLVQEGLVRPVKAQRSLVLAEQVPFDRIEQLARETKGQDQEQLKLFDAG